jgi:Iron only hydrogenase large subunit, C-terminal domain
MNSSGERDVDVVLTTRELAYLIKEMDIDFVNLQEENFDQPLGNYTGAGNIFGVTGGVMEAAIRTGYELITNQPIDSVDVVAVRGNKNFSESIIKVGDLELKVAVVAGLKNVEPIIEAMKNGKADYHFVEVMTCPEGCISGGGQPKVLLPKHKPMAYENRISGTYQHDSESKLRKSHENPAIKKLYKDFLKKSSWP